MSTTVTHAVQSKGVWSHLEGTATKPVAIGTTPPDAAELVTWLKDESIALDLLTQWIPDSTVIRTASQTDAAAMWKEIVREYTEKGTYAQTDLRTKFLESKCPDKGDVRVWLDSLRVQKEELAQVGVAIDEKDFRSTIISSLLTYLSGFASSQLAAARLYSATKTIDPDILISLVSEEYERQRTSRAHRNITTPSKPRDGDEVMAVSSLPKRKHGAPSRGRKPRVCWNCGEAGHFCDKCPKPKKARTTVSESAQVVQDSDDEAFGVSDADSMPDLASVSDSSESLVNVTTNADSMPDLVSVSNSSNPDLVSMSDDVEEEREDWFSDVDEDLNSLWGEGWETEELSGIESDCDSLLNVDLDLDAAACISTDLPHAIHTELYNSGTT